MYLLSFGGLGLLNCHLQYGDDSQRLKPTAEEPEPEEELGMRPENDERKYFSLGNLNNKNPILRICRSRTRRALFFLASYRHFIKLAEISWYCHLESVKFISDKDGESLDFNVKSVRLDRCIIYVSVFCSRLARSVKIIGERALLHSRDEGGEDKPGNALATIACGHLIAR